MNWTKQLVSAIGINLRRRTESIARWQALMLGIGSSLSLRLELDKSNTQYTGPSSFTNKIEINQLVQSAI